MTKGNSVLPFLDRVLPLGGLIKWTLLSTILNDPLWILTRSPAECCVAPIPSAPLSTLTVGTVDNPSDIFCWSSIFPLPSDVLENPTSVIFINSSFIFNTSDVAIEPIPLNENCDVPAPILTPNVWVKDVNVIGCCVMPSNPIIVLDNFLVIFNLCRLPEPTPVNVIAIPDVISCLVGNNWNLLISSKTLTKTVDGKISVVTPALFTVEPIETGVAATPTNDESGVYTNSSFVLKKWFGIVNVPVVFSKPTPSGSNVLV